MGGDGEVCDGINSFDIHPFGLSLSVPYQASNSLLSFIFL